MPPRPSPREHLFAGLAIGALCGAGAVGAVWVAGDDDPEPPRQPIAAEIDAAVVVDATVVEMRGYGPDGKPGKFLYDCEHADHPELGDPTLICTQREEP